jgi:4-amino-4-deoxy-L-arabinose transferase-like glycosyltransferase
LGVRLLGPLSFGVASLLLADAADRLFPDRDAGLRAAALLNATLLFGVGGVLMTPDSPLLVFWIGSLWALARLIGGGRPGWWLVAGLCAGLAIDSKYTAAMLWFGIALWLLVCPAARSWLRRTWPWLAGAIGLLSFVPVALWEAAHGWPSFVRQGGRLTDWHPAEAVRFLAELFAGQAGLATPLVFVLCVAGTVRATHEAWRTLGAASALLAALTLPPAVLFIQHGFGDRVQGNWPAVIYPAAAIAAGGLPAPVWRRLWRWAVALGLAVSFLVYIQATLTPLSLPAGYDPIARQLGGWRALAAEIDTVRLRTGAQFVLADQYGVAAELAWTSPPSVRVLAAEPRWALMNLLRPGITSQNGLLVRAAGHGDPPGSVPIATVERRQEQEIMESFRLYPITLSPGAADAVLLPRPR